MPTNPHLTRLHIKRLARLNLWLFLTFSAFRGLAGLALEAQDPKGPNDNRENQEYTDSSTSEEPFAQESEDNTKTIQPSAAPELKTRPNHLEGFSFYSAADVSFFSEEGLAPTIHNYKTLIHRHFNNERYNQAATLSDIVLLRLGIKATAPDYRVNIQAHTKLHSWNRVAEVSRQFFGSHNASWVTSDYYAWAQALFELYKNQEAVDVINLMMLNEPHFLSMSDYRFATMIYLRAGEISKAAETIEQALHRKNPNSEFPEAQDYLWAADMYFRLGKTERADSYEAQFHEKSRRDFKTHCLARPRHPQGNSHSFAQRLHLPKTSVCPRRSGQQLFPGSARLR